MDLRIPFLILFLLVWAVPVVILWVIVLRSLLASTAPTTDGATMVFPIAPMDTLNLVVTLITGAVVGFLPVFGPAILLVVWLHLRPERFEVSADGVRLVWPLRSALIPLASITNLGRHDRGGIGTGVRFGAGGFGGAFGLLLKKGENWAMYISRLDDLVLIHRADDRPMLISPVAPELFINSVQLLRAGALPSQGAPAAQQR